MANANLQRHCRFLSLDVVAEDGLRFADVSDLFNKLQCVEIVFHSTHRKYPTRIVLTTNIAHEHSIFQCVEPCFAVGDEASI